MCQRTTAKATTSTLDWSRKSTKVSDPIDGERQDLAGEPHLLDQRGVARPPSPTACRRPVLEHVEDEDARHQEEDEVGDRVRQDHAEDDVEHGDRDRRVDQRPDEPEDAVLVADLQLLADEVGQQLPVGDDVGDPGPQGDRWSRWCGLRSPGHAAVVDIVALHPTRGPRSPGLPLVAALAGCPGSGSVASAGVRLALDATPLLGSRTGVAHFTLGAFTALVRPRPTSSVRLCAELAGRSSLREVLPAGVTSGWSVPARPLLWLWARSDLVPASSSWTSTSGVDVVHGTNFVVPPDPPGGPGRDASTT